MANQEVINAINETMVSNGVKAINADSVRNLLLLMADKMGEGTGSGAVRVHMGSATSLDFSHEDTDGLELFSPEEVEIIMSMFAKIQQDNKAAYKLLNEHKEQGIADLVIGDQSFFGAIFLTFVFRMFEEVINHYEPDANVDWSSLFFSTNATMPLFYANIDADTSGLDENSLTIFEELLAADVPVNTSIPLTGISLFDPADEYGIYILMEDGSVMYVDDAPEPIIEYEPIIYLSVIGGMTEETIAANKKAYSIDGSQYSGVFWSVRENFRSDINGNNYFERGGCVHEIYEDITTIPLRKYFRFWKGTDMMQVTIDQDGNATLEVYASINPTA